MSSEQTSSAAIAVIPTGGLSTLPDGGSGLSVPMPFANRIVLLEDAHIAGTTHVRGIDEIAEQMQEGQELVLKRDTGNTQDAWAIRVLFDGKKVGYVPADRNEVIARLMDGGKKVGATISDKELLGTWHKIHMEVYLDD